VPTPTTTRPDVAPIRPCARNVRAALKAAGLAHLVRKVTTSKTACRVYLPYRATDEQARQVADALCPLWHDSDERVHEHSWVVRIDVAHYWHTMPATPEGLAQLAEREQERNAALLDASTNGRATYTSAYQSVQLRPDDEHPRRPWVDHDGRRYTPFQVYAS